MFTDRVFGGNPLAELRAHPAGVADGTVTNIRVGGGVVPVLEGELRI